MAKNFDKIPGWKESVACSYPASPSSGDPVRYGNRTGIALKDEDSAGKTVVHFGPGKALLSVEDSEASGITAGDVIWFHDATQKLNNTSSGGYYFGIAMAAVTAGETASILVFHDPAPGGAGTIGAGTVGSTQLAASAVTASKIGTGAVTNTKIGADAVDGDKIADDSIDSEHIAAGAIDTEHIGDKQVTNAKLATDNVKIATVALTAGLANAFAFAWENPESVPILVTRCIVDLSAAGGTATAVLDVGAATGAEVHGDNLLDGVDANSIDIYDNLVAADAGTNGKSAIKLDENGGTTPFITGQILTEAASSLEGNAYIFYTEV